MPAASFDDVGFGYHQGTSTTTAWNVGFSAGHKVRFFAHIATALPSGSASPTIGTPAGWTSVGTIAGTSVTIATNTAGAAPAWRTQVFERTMVSGDAAPTFTHSQGRFTYVYFAYGDWAADDVAVTVSGADAQTVPAITTTGTNRLLQMVVFNSGGLQAAGSYTPTGWTNGPADEIVDAGFDYNGIAVYAKAQVAAGSSGTKVADYSSGGPSQHVIFFASTGAVADTPPTAVAEARVGGVVASVVRTGEAFTLNTNNSTDDHTIPWNAWNPVWTQTSPASPVITLTPGGFGPVTMDGTAPSSGIAIPTSFTWQASVQDSIGQTDTDTVTLKVSSGPGVSAGPDQLVTVSGATTINLTGTPNAVSGTTISSRSWTRISGPTVTLTGGTTDNASFSTTNNATAWVFRYSATDSDGLTNTDDVTITTQAAVVSLVQFRPLTHTFTTGSDTATVELLIEVAGCAAGEQHYVDEVLIAPGVPERWSRGGLSGVAQFTVTRDEGSGEEDVRYAVDITPTSADEVVETIDYEVPLAGAATYRAYSFAADVSGLTYRAQSEEADTAVPALIWWLSDPLAPEVNVAVSVKGDSHSHGYSTEEISPSGSGQTYLTSIGPNPRTQRKFSWDVVALDKGELKQFSTILSTGRTLLLRDMAGDKRWVRPTAESWRRMFRNEIWDGSLTLVETQKP